ncbi:hypothetical protein FSP39_016012 [Pinctada imbricata]|uniref:Uncharacterized protein n=1 Tax=Pinctada imbricata TaxID=66713 RepID=A0AA88YDG3_PINIB|nr:hypothetical protein FSP39_016012 [Pinctada imbricata]
MLGVIGCACGISVLFQGLGVFSVSWIVVTSSNNSFTDCHLGLLWSQCDKDALVTFTNVTDPSNAVVGLQLSSFIIILLTTITFLIYASVCICDEDEEGGKAQVRLVVILTSITFLIYASLCICDEDEEGGKAQVICIICSCVIYVLTGEDSNHPDERHDPRLCLSILIISGCIGSAGEQTDASMGWSFYVSLTAGCYIIVKTIFSYIVACLALNSRHKPVRRRRRRKRRRIPSEAYKDNSVHTEDVTTPSKTVELTVPHTVNGVSSQKTESQDLKTNTGVKDKSVSSQNVERQDLHIINTDTGVSSSQKAESLDLNTDTVVPSQNIERQDHDMDTGVSSQKEDAPRNV